MNAHELLIMAIPALVALGGGILAAVWSPNHQMCSLIRHSELRDNPQLILY